MKFALIKIFIILFSVSLFLGMFPSRHAAGEFSREYDQTVITGFEIPDDEKKVDTEYKYALIELQKEFPAQIAIRLGGEVTFQDNKKISRVTNFVTKKIDTAWKCLENYDGKSDEFHFVPDIKGYELAPGVDLPVITVNILGEIPIPPMTFFRENDFDKFPLKYDVFSSKATLPTYYNNYENGQLPPLRNQSPYNTCWAFSTIAAIEADLIHDGKASPDIDLSELHLAYFTTHNFADEKNCNAGDTVTDQSQYGYLHQGGDVSLAGMMAINMLGPVYESEVPYEIAANYQPDPAEGRKGNIQITGFYYYVLADDKDSVKNAIMEHGAVSAFYYNNDNYYSYTNNSYYYPTDSYSNHAIVLVGWDDNFSSSNFQAGPAEGNGAWLVRNSWGGSGYGYSGYFWISYYDHSLSSAAYAFDAETRRYDHVYSYDNSPANAYNITYKRNILSQNFHISENELIRAIGYNFIFPVGDVVFSLSYGNTIVETEPVTTSVPGYYMIPLDIPVFLTEDTDVTVAFASPYNGYYVVTEKSDNYGGIYYSASCGSGLQLDGTSLGSDGRIKLFTDDFDYDLILPDDLQTIEREAFIGGAFSLVKLPDKAVSIGYHAFADCPNLIAIYVPADVTDIDPEAFGNNSKLTIVGAPGSYAETYAAAYGYAFLPFS